MLQKGRHSVHGLYGIQSHGPFLGPGIPRIEYGAGSGRNDGGTRRGICPDPIDWLGPLPEEQSRFRHRGLTPHWHANTVLSGGHRTDVIELIPASMKTVTMRPDNPGTWMYHCHVNDHIDAGMIALYTVGRQQSVLSGAEAD